MQKSSNCSVLLPKDSIWMRKLRASSVRRSLLMMAFQLSVMWNRAASRIGLSLGSVVFR